MWRSKQPYDGINVEDMDDVVFYKWLKDYRGEILSEVGKRMSDAYKKAYNDYSFFCVLDEVYSTKFELAKKRRWYHEKFLPEFNVEIQKVVSEIISQISIRTTLPTFPFRYNNSEHSLNAIVETACIKIETYRETVLQHFQETEKAMTLWQERFQDALQSSKILKYYEQQENILRGINRYESEYTKFSEEQIMRSKESKTNLKNAQEKTYLLFKAFEKNEYLNDSINSQEIWKMIRSVFEEKYPEYYVRYVKLESEIAQEPEKYAKLLGNVCKNCDNPFHFLPFLYEQSDLHYKTFTGIQGRSFYRWSCN